MRDYKDIRASLEQCKKIRSGFEQVTPKKKKNPYKNFLAYTYPNIEECVDDLTVNDLLYFFMKTTYDCGIRYSPIVAKDIPSLRRLKETYTNKEICIMIEFVFKSEQTYLTKETVRPTTIASSWQSTLFHDSQLWIEDKFVPKKKKSEPIREWKSDEKKTKVGEWE